MTQQRATFSPTFFCLRQDCPDIKLKLSCGWKGKGQRLHALPATDEIEHFVQELHVHYMQSSVTARRMAVLHIILPGQKSFTIKKPWRGGLPKVNQLNRSIKFIDQSRRSKRPPLLVMIPSLVPDAHAPRRRRGKPLLRESRRPD